jgi:NAD+ diphosphatase
MDHLTRSSRNTFARLSLDKSTLLRTDQAWVDDRLADSASRFVLVWRSQQLFSREPTEPVLLVREEVADLIDSGGAITLLGTRDGEAIFGLGVVAEHSDLDQRFAAHGSFKDLRRLSARLSADDAAVLAYSRAMAYWHQHHVYCGKCGASTVSTEAGHCRVCSDATCAQQHHPRTDPAIIVLVEYEDRCLLARQSIWPPTMYSSIAGFVEPGETLESAVVREVFEETNISVKEVHYHSSQPWPFPCSIMLGFHAVADSTDIKLNDGELEDALWLSREELVERISAGSLQVPPSVSIAYRLVEHWYDAGELGTLAQLNERLAGRATIEPGRIRTPE